MRLTFLTASLFALTALPALAKDPECRWAKSWDEAVAEAKARNVPIHVAFQDDSKACTGMDTSVYANKELVAASKRWVNVYCNRDSGHGKQRVGEREMCKRHPEITCEEHIECNSIASGKYFQGAFRMPATVWCKSDGTEIGKVEGGLSAKQVIEKMRWAETIVGPGLDTDAYDFLLDRLAVGEKAAADGRTKDAVDAYAAAVKTYGKHPAAKKWTDEAQAALDQLAGVARRKIADAATAKDAGDFAKARDLLASVQTDFKGQPVVKEADKAMAEVVAAEKAAGKK